MYHVLNKQVCFLFCFVLCFKCIDAVSNGWESSWGFQPLLQISALSLWLHAPPSLSPSDHHQHWSANHFSCNYPHNKLFKKPWNLTLLQISTAAAIALKRSPLPHHPRCYCFSTTFQGNQITSLEIITTAPPENLQLLYSFKIWRALLHLTMMCLLCSPPQRWLNVHLVCRLGPH